MAGTQDGELYQLTETVHGRLPLELRRMVYEAMLDEETIKDIPKCVSVTTTVAPRFFGPEITRLTTLDRYPHHPRWRPKFTPPAFMNWNEMYGPMTAELIEAFFGKYRDYRVLETNAIANYLKADFFGVGVTLSHIALPEIEVQIRPDDATPAYFQREFEPLLNPGQRWSNNFSLTISFKGPNYGPDKLKMWKVVRSLQPILVKAKVRGAEVYVDYISEVDDFEMDLTEIVHYEEEEFLNHFYRVVYDQLEYYFPDEEEEEVDDDKEDDEDEYDEYDK